MNTETQEQKVQTLRSTLSEMIVSELPKVHASSHDATPIEPETSITL